MINTNETNLGSAFEGPMPDKRQKRLAQEIDSSLSPEDEHVTMAGKPVIYRDASTVLTIRDGHEFEHKWLCNGITLNNGDACVFGCGFCYVGPAMRKLLYRLIDDYNRAHGTNFRHEDFVIRRRNSLDLLKRQLLRRGNPRFSDPADDRVVYTSTLVDVAANMELLRETAAACELILEHTSWQIRLLSKSSLLSKLVSDEMIPKKYHHRLIFGFSTGTLDDRVARVIETGTASVSMRLKSLHWLQDNGFRTFAMICPSLPQSDYLNFSRKICEAVRVDKCEEVWAEVINVRGESFTRTLAALHSGGLTDEALALSAVSGPGAAGRWEQYARHTFLAHAENVPPDKLRFLQYIRKDTADWWLPRMADGAVLIGSEAKRLDLLTVPERSHAKFSTKPATKKVPVSTREHRNDFARLNKVVVRGIDAFMEAGRALQEIHDRELWVAGGFETWADYCKKTAGLSRSYAHRLMVGARMAEELTSPLPTGNTDPVLRPRLESQVRPLVKLTDPAQRQLAWMRAVDQAGGAQPTATVVTSVVKELTEPTGEPILARNRKSRRTQVLSELKGVVEQRESWDEVERLLRELVTIG